MRKIPCLFIVILALSGCSTKTAYLNTQKTAEAVEKDKTDCQQIVDMSDFKDADLRQKKFNQCMKDRGYDVVSQEKAQKIQGFVQLWIKPGVDLKSFEAIIIEEVNLSQVKVKEGNILDTEVTREDIDNLGKEMLERFSKALSTVMPVISDKGSVAGKKVLYVCLKLKDIAKTKVGANAALQVAGHFSPVPLPSAPIGTFSFEGEICDYSSKEKLITIADECEGDKNASLAGLEAFENWKHAYNVMDYWADKLAGLIAKERGEKYKAQTGFKLIDY